VRELAARGVCAFLASRRLNRFYLSLASSVSVFFLSFVIVRECAPESNSAGSICHLRRRRPWCAVKWRLLLGDSRVKCDGELASSVARWPLREGKQASAILGALRVCVWPSGPVLIANWMEACYLLVTRESLTLAV